MTTLTKKLAEDLSTHLAERPPLAGVLGRPLSVSFLHSGVDSVARMEVLEQIKRPVVAPADAAAYKSSGWRPRQAAAASASAHRAPPRLASAPCDAPTLPHVPPRASTSSRGRSSHRRGASSTRPVHARVAGAAQVAGRRR